MLLIKGGELLGQELKGQSEHRAIHATSNNRIADCFCFTCSAATPRTIPKALRPILRPPISNSLMVKTGLCFPCHHTPFRFEGSLFTSDKFPGQKCLTFRYHHTPFHFEGNFFTPDIPGQNWSNFPIAPYPGYVRGQKPSRAFS